MSEQPSCRIFAYIAGMAHTFAESCMLGYGFLFLNNVYHAQQASRLNGKVVKLATALRRLGFLARSTIDVLNILLKISAQAAQQLLQLVGRLDSSHYCDRCFCEHSFKTRLANTQPFEGPCPLARCSCSLTPPDTDW